MYTRPSKITKVVRVGTIMYWHRTKELPTDIYCTIEFSSDNTLSITGVIGPRANGDAWGGCGQICWEFDHRDPSQNDKRYRNPIEASDITFAKGWNSDLWYGFLNIWDTYHLSQSNCEHQAIMGVTYQNNPNHVCPVCGYKIGSAWKHHNIPNAVIELLCSLPNADKPLPEVWARSY